MTLKPIRHGYSDPSEIPYWCKKCEYYSSNGTDFPKCTKREDGRFKPEIEFSCRKIRTRKKEPND